MNQPSRRLRGLWRHPWTPGLLYAFTVMLWLPMPAGACPTCKESLLDLPQAQQVRQTAKGYAVSIGLLIGTPLVLVGTVATLIVRRQRRRGVVGSRAPQP